MDDSVTVLRKLRAYIKQNMRLDDEILDALEADRILNNEDIEDIQAERTDTRKISTLLRILLRKGPHAFQSFLNALSTDYAFLTEELFKEYLETKRRSHTNNDEKELRAPHVPEENSTNNDETELKTNHVPEESCTKSDETQLKTNYVPEERGTIRDKTEVKAYVPEVSGTKTDETKLKTTYVPEESCTNSNQTENPEESSRNNNEDQNAINNLQESIRAFHRSPTYASMYIHSDHNSTQSHLNIIYTMLKMHLIFMNEREDFFGSPELATFVMIKPLLDKVIDLGQESYRLVRGAHKVSLKQCIETMITENTNLQRKILEREQRIQKYANKIRLLETKIQDYEAQLRQKDIRLNQRESELEEARSTIQTLESKLEKAESSLWAKHEDFDTNYMKLTELTEENKELKKKVAANDNRNKSTRYIINNGREGRNTSNGLNLGIAGFQVQRNFMR